MRNYRLPTIPVSSTEDENEYLNAWDSLAKKLEFLLPKEYRVSGVDPRFNISDGKYCSFELPLDVVLHLTSLNLKEGDSE